MSGAKDVKLGLFVKLVAKPGKELEVEQFLRSGLAIVQDEPGTLQWYAVKFDSRTFAIFDTFGDEKGRNAHLTGRVAEALMAKAGEFLAQPPSIEKHDVLACKL